MSELHIVRSTIMRVVYFLTFVGLVGWWPALFAHTGNWSPMEGVGISFYAVLSLLALVGVVYPIQMIPLMLAQLLYKSTWVLFVGLPILSTGVESSRTDEFMMANSVGMVIDVIAIPWIFLFKKYFGRPKLRP